MKEIMAVRRAGLTREQSVSVARNRVTPGSYLIRSHGLWFRPNSEGHTTSLSDAGVFNAAIARNYLIVEGISVVPLESVRDDLSAEINSTVMKLAALTELLKNVNSLKTEQ